MRTIATAGFLGILLLSGGCATDPADTELSSAIRSDARLDSLLARATEIMSTGFNAGDGYREVWIRDYNTFINLALDVHPMEIARENLLVFFRLQGEDGNIADGFVPREQATVGYDYILTDLEPDYAGHKNTVETDQEASLVQAVRKYVDKSGDRSFLDLDVGGISVRDRLERSLEYLLADRFDARHGLLIGATTADWGDVQPEDDWGVAISENTHWAIDIYDNAMFSIALRDFAALAPERAQRWNAVRDSIHANVREFLWDEELQKFIPHIYLDGSPFPEDFDERAVFYHGGTAVAIEAGMLSKEEILISLAKMVDNMEKSGAATLGLTLYPPYPEGSFKNPGMGPYSYQNGGDWTWFGGRMIQQLALNGFIEEAWTHLQPMVQRVIDNDGFYEWYTVDNRPMGSGTFRGEAGVLYDAILLLRAWAEQK